MYELFELSHFNGNISQWDVSNVRDMSYMFVHSSFTQDISQWKPYSLNNVEGMFQGCLLSMPYWYSKDINEIKFKLKKRDLEELKLKIDSELSSDNVEKAQYKL